MLYIYKGHGGFKFLKPSVAMPLGARERGEKLMTTPLDRFFKTFLNINRDLKTGKNSEQSQTTCVRLKYN